MFLATTESDAEATTVLEPYQRAHTSVVLQTSELDKDLDSPW